MFVPPSIYFKDVERKLVDISVPNGIKSIDDRIDELVQFLEDDTKKVFLLHAFGGFGKSHFLKIFPRRLIDSGINREIWFIKNGIGDYDGKCTVRVPIPIKVHGKLRRTTSRREGLRRCRILSQARR